MLSQEDLTNLLVLVRRSTFKDLNEAKAGVILESKLVDILKGEGKAPKEAPEQEPDDSATDSS